MMQNTFASNEASLRNHRTIQLFQAEACCAKHPGAVTKAEVYPPDNNVVE